MPTLFWIGCTYYVVLVPLMHYLKQAVYRNMIILSELSGHSSTTPN